MDWKGIQSMIVEKDGCRLARILKPCAQSPRGTDSLAKLSVPRRYLAKQTAWFYTPNKPSTQDPPGWWYQIWQCLAFSCLLKLLYTTGKLLTTMAVTCLPHFWENHVPSNRVQCLKIVKELDELSVSTQYSLEIRGILWETILIFFIFVVITKTYHIFISFFLFL